MMDVVKTPEEVRRVLQKPPFKGILEPYFDSKDGDWQGFKNWCEMFEIEEGVRAEDYPKRFFQWIIDEWDQDGEMWVKIAEFWYNRFRKVTVWKPSTHSMFPASARQRVKTVLMLAAKKPDGTPYHPECQFYKLPKAALFLVLSHAIHC